MRLNFLLSIPILLLIVCSNKYQFIISIRSFHHFILFCKTQSKMELNWSVIISIFHLNRTHYPWKSALKILAFYLALKHLLLVYAATSVNRQTTGLFRILIPILIRSAYNDIIANMRLLAKGVQVVHYTQATKLQYPLMYLIYLFVLQ